MNEVDQLLVVFLPSNLSPLTCLAGQRISTRSRRRLPGRVIQEQEYERMLGGENQQTEQKEPY